MENVSPSLITNHYHTTYIPFNISSIKFTLSQFLTNIVVLKPLVDEQNNKAVTTLYFHTYKLINHTYSNYEKLKLMQSKNRRKRGLINFLGSGIKFITGNLDDKDLDTITQNFDILKRNQLNSMHKINELSSFAGNIMNKFKDTLDIINKNSNTIKMGFSKLSNELTLNLCLQDQYIQINDLNQLLEKLLRMISFAHLETLDLEILSPSEINEIWKYLKIHYPKKALWPIQHITELTLICKTGLLIMDDMVILAIKIPVFEVSACDLKFVYPVPNNESQIVITPSKFYCNELWYKVCNEISDKWICSNPLIDSCILSKNCQYALVHNNYKVHTLTHAHALLFCTKTSEIIYEDCFRFEKVLIDGCTLLQSKCDVIIDKQKYSLAINNVTTLLPDVPSLQITNFSLNLKIKHLDNPGQVQDDLLEPIKFEELLLQNNSHLTLVIITSICIIVLICAFCVIFYQWKKHKDVKVIPLKTLQNIINEDVELT